MKKIKVFVAIFVSGNIAAVDCRTIVSISRTHSVPWVLQVSKPGTNPFCLSTQVTAMRALVKALNLITLAGSMEKSAAHGLTNGGEAVERINRQYSTQRRGQKGQKRLKGVLGPFGLGAASNVAYQRVRSPHHRLESVGGSSLLVTSKDDRVQGLRGPAWHSLRSIDGTGSP